MHPQHQPVWRRDHMRARGGDENGSPSRRGLLGFIPATAEAIDMVEPTPIRPNTDGHMPSTPETNVDRSPRNGKRPRRGISFPVTRSILAVDIEGSTQRTNPVKGELRDEVYRIVDDAFGEVGIDEQHCDPIIDRGDGLLVLLRPTDDFPKPFLLSRLMPALARLLATRNSGISPAEKPRIMRLRAVIHAGDVHYDGNGPFGEDLDVAFRLLDAPRFKAYLKTASEPLAVVASDTIYQSIIRHGYDGLDGKEFDPLVNVTVGFRRRKGWVQLPRAGRFSIVVPAQAQAAYAS
jgi:class 3 adenylate cyclase